MRSIIGLFLLLTVSLPPMAGLAASRQPNPPVRFDLDAGVSDQDRAFIREGVRLAADYIDEVFDVRLQHTTTVTVRSGDPGPNPPAQAGVAGILIYPDHPVWATTSPLQRYKIVVHEYFHVVQEYLGALGPVPGPAWLMEGSAEYVAYLAVADRGLIAYDDVRLFHGFNVAVTQTPFPPLSRLETVEQFGAVVAPTYSYAALAVEALVADRGIEALYRFFAAIGSGAIPWQTAFLDAFGITPEDFSAAFEGMLPGFFADYPGISERLGHDAAPMEGAFDLVLERIPASVSEGGQAVVTGWSTPGATCSLALQETGQVWPTHADAIGAVFWLWSVPGELSKSTLSVEVRCGGQPVMLLLDVSSPAHVRAIGVGRAPNTLASRASTVT